MIPTKEFPHKDILDFSALFPTFNPVQSAALEFLSKDGNVVLSSPTGSGKTEVAEMFIARALSQGKKAVYLVPFKAIGEEKFHSRWANRKHSFSRYDKILMTGDYEMTESRKGDLEKAKIIAATSEMLDHRTRHMKSENSKWIFDVGALIVDEAHLLTDGNDGDGRGHKLECAIMRFAQYNPKARIILLSATMPNVDELSNWLTTLTGRPTDLYVSDYRPCKLTRHFVKYYDGGNMFSQRALQMQKCIEIIRQYPENQFLVFTSTKKWGREFLAKLQASKIPSDFHNADKRRDELSQIESKFRSGEIRALIATQTLGAGVNLPARRVIIAHVTYGRSQDVPVYEIHQKEGRSGRLGLDTEGDSYILIPETSAYHHEKRIQAGEKITSQMNNNIALSFHLLGEISYGNVTNLATAKDWYRRTFAYHQFKSLPSQPTLEQIFNVLKECKMVYFKDGEFHLTALGRVCSMFYLHPVDVHGWYKNFSEFFRKNPEADSSGSKEQDVLIGVCLANVLSNYELYPFIVEPAEDDRDQEFITKRQFDEIYEDAGLELYVKDNCKTVGYLIYAMMNGINLGDGTYSITKTLENDHERILQAIATVDSLVTHWEQEAFWKMLNLRFNYKVPARFIPLVKLDGVGKAIAYKLYNLGLKNAQDIVNNPEVVKKLGPKRSVNLLTSAERFLYNSTNKQVDLPLEGIHG